MAANTWATIPGNTLASIDPRNNPAINPNYQGVAPWSGIVGQYGVVGTWCGMAYDYATDTMWFPLQGGHGDYGGNEPYKRRLDVDTPNYVMLRNPSGAIGNLMNCNDTSASVNVYPDGRLRPGHSYNCNTYVPGQGPVLSCVTAPYPTIGGYQRAFALNEVTGEATPISSVDMPGTYGAAEYDSKRNALWVVSTGNTPLSKLDLTTQVVTTVVASNNYVSSYVRMFYLPVPDVLLVVHAPAISGYPQEQFYLWDLSTTPPTRIPVTTSGAFPSTHSIASGSAGMDWDYANNRLLLWQANATAGATTICTLTPPTNLKTGTWVIGTLYVAAGNTVTPTIQSVSGGVYGRFRYSARLGGCLLLNDYAQPTYFFATE